MLRVILALLATLLLGALLVIVILWFHPILVHLSQETGTSNASSRAYDFWSGFGSDLGELAILGAILNWFRMRNCGVKGCFRLGHHSVEGTPHKTCHRHATIEHHDRLHANHRRDHPDQHALFNRKKDV